MFSNISKQIYQELIKQDFSPFNNTDMSITLTDETLGISLVKLSSDIVYIVNLFNTFNYSPEVCMGKAEVDKSNFTKNYSKLHIKFINIFLCTDNSTNINYINKLDKNFLCEFKDIFWSVEFSDNKISMYNDKLQPNKLLGIEKIINSLNIDTTTGKKETISRITAKAIIDSPLRAKPSLVQFYRVIMLVNIVIFFSISLTSNLSNATLLKYGAFSYERIIYNNEYYRIFTSMFLHANLMHLSSNMLTLYIFGKGLEATTTHLNFLAIYFLSGIVANVLMLSSPSSAIMVGASGCIFGLIGACLILTFYFKKSIYGLNFSAIFTLAIINLAISIAIPNISFEVHFIGFIIGIILGYFYALELKK